MYMRTHTHCHAPANGVLYDDTHLQLALLSLQAPHLEILVHLQDFMSHVP